MKILYIHADYLRYWTKKKAKASLVEEITEERKQGEFDNPLIAFTAVEKSDEFQKKTIIEKAVKDITDLAAKIKPETIVLYPFAHLTHDLASAENSLSILRSIEEKLGENNHKVVRTPFGWYKSFELKCKGHPLAELSRHI